MNRLILAGERTMGRAYGQDLYDWPSTEISRRALRDNAEPGRMIERLMARVIEVFDRFRPDIVVAGQTASPEGIAVMMVAAARNIPLLVNRPSKLLSHRCFWTLDPFMWNRRADAMCRDSVVAGHLPDDEAMKRLEAFRAAPETVAYIKRNWDIAAAMSWLQWHKNIVLQLASWASWVCKGRIGTAPREPIPKIAEYYRIGWRKRVQRKLFASLPEDRLAGMRYVLIALHKEPELALNYQAAQWHSQKALISWLSANLPAGYRLLVREHRFNEGRRTTAFLNEVRMLPGVMLISPFDSQFKYIRHAAAIVTDTGSTGWEGLVFGRPVISLSENYYTATGLTEEVTDPARLGAAILRSVLAPQQMPDVEYNRRLALLLQAEFQTTVVQNEQAQSLNASLESIDALMGRVEAV
ncbi:MAG: hypothetical protein CTR53_05545 [Ferrovibrio sp.]|nr:MAG: hypothetical protein CTR53_05545 [Ferrovibrio sp.]